MRVLFVGDIFAEAGRICVRDLVPGLREAHAVDLVIANGENATRGMGIGARHAKQVLSWGVDAMTLGNHSFRQRDLLPMLATDDRIIRPANFAAKAPGKGIMFVTVTLGEGADATEHEVAVINIQGSLFIETPSGPFEIIDSLIEQARARTPIVLVDMHAEATSEKIAMAHYVDGRVSALVGTHTHVQTSDARVLPKGTAYQTDLGMTGPHDSVIGVRAEIIIKRFTTGIGERFEPAHGGAQLEGALIDIDEATGLATAIKAIRVPLPPERISGHRLDGAASGDRSVVSSRSPAAGARLRA